MANLIGSATFERLLQYATVASPSGRNIQGNFAAPEYTKIASAAMTSLQIADVNHLPPFDVWINKTSISYDGQDIRLGTFSRQGCAPVRVFIETAVSYDTFHATPEGLKAAMERVKEVALWLKEPRHFGFATMACLGVVTDMNDEDRLDRNIRLVYELPPAADPLAPPVSLHDLLSLDKYRLGEPSEVDVRFQLVNSLAKALHEMHCTGWLHRNISSNDIFFLKTKHGSGIESLDLEKPYMGGFHAARSFYEPSFSYRFEALTYKHPGYLLHRKWSEHNAEHGDIGDKSFYMPRHDYYSMGLVFLEIGMWRSIHSFVLRDAPYFDYRRKPPNPRCALGNILETLTEDVDFARRDMAENLNQDTEEEKSGRRRMLEEYFTERAKFGIWDRTENPNQDTEEENSRR